MSIIARISASARGVALPLLICAPLGACSGLDEPASRRLPDAIGARHDVNRIKKESVIADGAPAHTPAGLNWSALSAQGSFADPPGDQGGAPTVSLAALKIAPGELAVMSSLGLSCALSKELTRAGESEPPGGADPRTRQNDAPVLSLRGEAADEAAHDIADGNVTWVGQTSAPRDKQPARLDPWPARVDSWAALQESAPGRKTPGQTAALGLRPTL
jgi:hypothetical protein